jgi:hypothetical protein
MAFVAASGFYALRFALGVPRRLLPGILYLTIVPREERARIVSFHDRGSIATVVGGSSLPARQACTDWVELPGGGTHHRGIPPVLLGIVASIVPHQPAEGRAIHAGRDRAPAAARGEAKRRESAAVMPALARRLPIRA